MDKAPVQLDRVGDVTIIKFTAPSLLDNLTIELINDEFDRIVHEMGRCRLIVDFTNVKLMSSSALGIFIKVHQAVQSAKGRIILCGIRDALMESFRISQLHKIFEFSKTIQSAMQQIEKP